MLENLEITRQSDQSVCGLVVWLRFFRTVSCPCWDTCWGFRSFIIEIKQLKLRFLDWIHADIGWHWMTISATLRLAFPPSNPPMPPESPWLHAGWCSAEGIAQSCCRPHPLVAQSHRQRSRRWPWKAEVPKAACPILEISPYLNPVRPIKPKVWFAVRNNWNTGGFDMTICCLQGSTLGSHLRNQCCVSACHMMGRFIRVHPPKPATPGHTPKSVTYTHRLTSAAPFFSDLNFGQISLGTFVSCSIFGWNAPAKPSQMNQDLPGLSSAKKATHPPSIKQFNQFLNNILNKWVDEWNPGILEPSGWIWMINGGMFSNFHPKSKSHSQHPKLANPCSSSAIRTSCARISPLPLAPLPLPPGPACRVRRAALAKVCRSSCSIQSWSRSRASELRFSSWGREIFYKI